MPFGKDRIYLALYARGGQPRMPGREDKYHWGIVIGPKPGTRDAKGRMFHAREKRTCGDGVARLLWEFEEREISMEPRAMVLVRIVVGKVASVARLESALRSTPVHGDQPGWNCLEWVKDALEALEKDGAALGDCNTNWSAVRNTAMRYVEEKKAQHRFDGKGNFDLSKVATWNMLEGKELVP